MEIGGVPVVTPSSGRGIPILGMGTAENNLQGSERVKLAILKAIEVGYRHFDTAYIYQTEGYLGEAVDEALQNGLIKSRDELFVTSKLWCADAYPDHNLKLEYLDLYLIHWPVSLKPGKFVHPIPMDEIFPINYKYVWAAMEKCQMLGLTKSIGVSNFSCKKLQYLMATANIPPDINQVEMNPIWKQQKLRDYCKTNNIMVTVYSPLGAKGTMLVSSGVMDSEVLNQISQVIGKFVAQVSLRWIYEQGASLLVKSFNEERMKEKLKIFDWELEDLKKISELPQRRVSTGDHIVSINGPFKSVEELWDDEV
ncbi:hypothetical protein MKX03_001857 [Papaver bracteatum]|nr:hypothetical protein MKX03_001857 [Papaver bracteatum]